VFFQCHIASRTEAWENRIEDKPPTAPK